MSAFVCVRCGKEFTVKNSLIRHVKNFHENPERFKCGICEKKFSRLDCLQRHRNDIHFKKSTAQCEFCGKTVSRERYLKTHKCPPASESDPKPSCSSSEIPDRVLPFKKRKSSYVFSDQSENSKFIPSKKRKCLKIKRPQNKEILELEDEQLEGNDEVTQVMRQFFSSIRTFSKRSFVQSVFNFFLKDDFRNIIPEIEEKIMHNQFTRFKINYSLGFILKNIKTNQIRYYHSSYNNALILKTALLISNQKELLEFLNSISAELFPNHVSRPDTSWRVVDITNITFFVNHLKDSPLGSLTVQLPDFVLNNHGLKNFLVDDNLCFFRCLSVFKGADRRRCQRDANNLFNEYCNHFCISPDHFQGVSCIDFVKLENLYQINIVVYKLNDRFAELVCKSREIYDSTMRLNLSGNHLSLISNFDVFCHKFKCDKCDQLFDKGFRFNRHVKTCTEITKKVYPGGIFTQKPTIFNKLEKIGICIPKTDRMFPFFACYDFESFFTKNDLPGNGPKLTFETKHHVLSVAISSNVPRFDEGKCFVSDGNEKQLVQNLIDYLKEISAESYKNLRIKFDYVFEALENSENENKAKLTAEFERYLSDLIVLGFNSGSYDINLCKKYFFELLVDEIEFVIKKCNHYLCVKTKQLRFLDIKNYLAPGFSYRKFLLAYKAEAEKFFFPYEFVTDLSKLETGLPEKQFFFSSLTNSNISDSDYELVKNTWQEKGWTCLKELLVYYNLLDVKPFCKAIENFLEPYYSKHIDVFKRAFSVSGIAKIEMQRRSTDGKFFCLFPKRHADLYDEFKSQITGGLSMIFTRLAVAGQTLIRPHEVENPQVAKKVFGFDANSLYLYSINKHLPSSYFCRYRDSNYFRPEPVSKFGLQSYQWLSFLEHSRGIFIQSKFNVGEKSLTPKNLLVDGFCEANNTVFEFLGCFFHSCSECDTNRNSDGSLALIHPLKKIEHEEIRRKTAEKKQILESFGYEVVQITECQWLRKRKETSVANFVKQLKMIQPRKQLNSKKIIEGVENGTLFGFVIVDIFTPNELKDKFKDFPLIIKNTFVSRDDIGSFMKSVAEEQGLLKKPEKFLISSYFGDKILLSTNLCKFYLEMGLKISKVYEFIEFFPQRCFSDLADQIVTDRRRADSNPIHQITALTQKLLGNSLYSAALMNKEKHRKVSYHTNDSIFKAINNPRFVNLEVIKSNLYEVTSLKSKITLDLPIQVAHFVYQEAKRHLLSFVYLFIKKYIPRECYSLLELDTDSCYMILSKDNLDDCVQENRREYFEEKCRWMPVECCEEHKQEFVSVKAARGAWLPQECCKQALIFQQRTLGLFKREFEGHSAVCLAPKTYFCGGTVNKQVSKGINILQNPLSFSDYEKVLLTDEPKSITNRGFRVKQNSVFTYQQQKKGLNSFFCKRIVLDDKINTEPLQL